MKFAVLLITLISLAVVSGVYTTDRASAAVNYTYSYDFTNRYNTELITYTFTALDPNVTYSWIIYTANPITGGLQQTFGRFTSTPADRSTAGTPTEQVMPFGGVDFSSPLGTINYPQGYVGPIGVADSNGTVIGRHFIAELPTHVTTQDSDWFDGGSGNTALGERQVIGNTQFRGTCRNPVYNEFNVDGWLHSFTPCSVSTIENGWAILHYQVTAAYNPAVDDHDIIFFRVPSANEFLDLSLNELIAFQQPGGYSPGATRAFFVIVNTSGQLLPFLDNTACATAFTLSRNPCVSEMEPQIYNYGRFDGGTPNWISDGESVWVVTQDPNLREWGLSIQSSEIGLAGTQTATVTAVTEAVWDSYHGSQVLEDGLQGTIDSTVYAFTPSHTYTYQVANAESIVFVGWAVEPTALNSGLATQSEMGFSLATFYTIVALPTFEEQLNQVLSNTGLDTPSGKAAVLTMILFVGMLGTAAFSGLRANIFAYLIMWTGLGAVFIIGGFSTLLVTTVFGVLTIAMWVFAILMLQSDAGEAG